MILKLFFDIIYYILSIILSIVPAVDTIPFVDSYLVSYSQAHTYQTNEIAFCGSGNGVYFFTNQSGVSAIKYVLFDARSSSTASSTSSVDYSLHFGLAILIFLSSFTMWGFVFNSFDKKSYA